jgi:acetyltransferase-like isoleucine patch superfamily enzyme
MNLLLKLIAKIINSRLFFNNPYIKIEEIIDFEEIIGKRRINRCLQQVNIGLGSRFFNEALVHNLQINKKSITIGKNTYIRSEMLVFPYGGKIIIGDNCYLGKNTIIWSASNIFIGNGVLISHSCNIIDTNTHETNHEERVQNYKLMLKQGHPKTKPNLETKPIIIQDYVWISFGVTILKGVSIGKGAIIAANSVVTKDVEAFSLVAGNPAKFVKKISNK